ncbi:hypothetical protein D3C71_2130650 [compost metagenome]
MKLADIRTNAGKQFGSLFKIGRFVAIRIEAEIGERRRHHIRRGIENMDAAILELGG